MNRRTVKYVKDAKVCAQCAYCRSTMGDNAKFYCHVRPITKKKCEQFEGAFVEAFSIPVNN